jgi:hypothetical protein
MMVIHESPTSAVPVLDPDQRAASARARHNGNVSWTQPVQFHVTVATERHAVGQIEAMLQCICPASDVVRGETALVFLALSSAPLALVAIALEDRSAPRDVPRIAESLPGSPALPVVMSRTTRRLHLSAGASLA